MAEINKVGSGLPAPRLRPNANAKIATAPGKRSADEPAAPTSADIGNRLRTADSFDAAKVEQIGNAIRSGQYPIDSKRIAENFLQLESLLSDTVKRG